MPLSLKPWSISKEDLELAMRTPMPSIRDQFFKQMVSAERRYVEEGVKRALGLWVSELEPELMFRYGEARPFGITARGHGTPYIEINWDPNFHPLGESIRYPVGLARHAS